ncbi:MAG: 4-hydroxyphenylpyruvate dioxygenase [Cyanobacteria bacterium P01_F01_bin.53]
MDTSLENDCPILRFDHLEFYVGNARQAANFYRQQFGFMVTAYRSLETGERKAAAYVLEQGNIRFVLTSAFKPDNPIAQFALKHGDSVAAIAFEVADVNQVYRQVRQRGAIAIIPPTEITDEMGVFRYAAVQGYGDMLIKLIERQQYRGAFAPGFVPNKISSTDWQDRGLTNLDHVVGNVGEGAMDKWVDFFIKVFGFELLVHFDDKTIATEYTALMSKVVQDPTGNIKLPINEPAPGKRLSQIAEYLQYHQGPGVQHIALATNNIIDTVTQLKAAGVKFLSPPPTYYEGLAARVGQIAEPLDKLAQLGILVDRDADGYLLQIFTQPVQDRPTLFFEIIERHGATGFGAPVYT